MTPQQITDHKFNWHPGITVTIHSDVLPRCKAWCKLNVPCQMWNSRMYTTPYRHSFRFELKHDADLFRTKFNPWTDMPDV